MPIVRFIHNSRINSDLNISIQVESIIETKEEAEALGAQLADFFAGYLDGFTRDSEEESS